MRNFFEKINSILNIFSAFAMKLVLALKELCELPTLACNEECLFALCKMAPKADIIAAALALSKKVLFDEYEKESTKEAKMDESFLRKLFLCAEDPHFPEKFNKISKKPRAEFMAAFNNMVQEVLFDVLRGNNSFPETSISPLPPGILPLIANYVEGPQTPQI